MNLLRLRGPLGLVASGVAAISLLIACSHSEGASNVGVDELTEGQVLDFATCSLQTVPANLDDIAIPSEEQDGIFSDVRLVSRDQVLTEAAIRLTLKPGPEGQKTIAKLEATVAHDGTHLADPTHGILTFDPAMASESWGKTKSWRALPGGVNVPLFDNWEVIQHGDPVGGTLMFGSGPTGTINSVLLQRDWVSGKGWMVLGDGEHLVAMAAGCSFTSAWEIVMGGACEDVDGGVDGGSPPCGLTSDGGAATDAQAADAGTNTQGDAAPDAATDAQTQHPPAAPADASVDGAITRQSRDVGQGQEETFPPPTNGSTHASSTETTPLGAINLAPKNGNGCNTARGGSSSSLGIAALSALALVSVRRRRRWRTRAGSLVS